VRDNLDQLKVRGRKDPKENVFQLLHNWLNNASNGPWLVVLDNVDDARVLLEKPPSSERISHATGSVQHAMALLDCLPQCAHGKVLVTSRTEETAKELVDLKDIIAVNPMMEDEALALLQMKLEVRYTEQYALRLARELDFMPLALTQAAAYIFQSKGRCSIQQYLVKLGQSEISRASVLNMDRRDLRRDQEASNSIMLTWQISFNHIREVRPSAADLLSLMSFFDHQAIPEALLQETGSGQTWNEDYRGDETRIGMAVVDDKDDNASSVSTEAIALNGCDVSLLAEKVEEFEKDIVVLRSYHFVSQPADITIFEMHRLVQLATKRWLKANCLLERWSSQFISNLNDAFPVGGHGNWETCRPLFPHAAAALHTKVTGWKAVLCQASLLLRSGQYASTIGDYTGAEKMEKRSLQARMEILGGGHSDTLTSMNNLALTYWNQGRWNEAEKLQVEVMERRKEVLREGHSDILTSMNNLALTYWNQGRWNEAEKLQIKVIEKRKEVLGEMHPDTLTGINNLGMTYSRQGKWEEAEKLQVDVAEKRKKVLREGHPDTLTSISNLALTYSNQGRWNEAEKLQVGVIEKRKEVLGEMHPDTLTSMNNLGTTYLRQGQLERAEELQVEVTERRKEVLGEMHPDTLRSMNNLGMTFSRQGQWEKTEKLQVETMERRKEVLGEGHRDTLSSMNNLVMTYSDQGRWNEAEKLQEEVLKKSKEALGERHPDTLMSMSDLALIFRDLGRRRSALDLMSLCAGMSQSTLGVSHPDTIAVLYLKEQWEMEAVLDGPVDGPAEARREAEEASIGKVDNAGGGRQDATEEGITWSQPQFLWLL
jgi:tetratricopeptide (TPR) repeat protein